MAAILDAILNFSKCSRLTEVHLADSEWEQPQLPISVEKKNTLQNISRFIHTSAGLKLQVARALTHTLLLSTDRQICYFRQAFSKPWLTIEFPSTRP